ncbi:TetR/AcrR family transcriptional regulator [Pseudaminobacter sp. 19-2017]|uniref:TetR/AcrR family transcriptional regulator n=1 Tax=Pseudaminobacter soli (ex Zhang et al. 2022) TaxID=2831468 RepID=A0A942E2Z7_9HYPH|nr:TetR/AcrR family transcriptional regulator [Pseudaminobacter soli]MBS3650066.1 TetR/AcrR family transcriptional regulator [Pseudaminobacter soli]
MPRPKTMSDEEALQAALDLIHIRGPEALTFASLSQSCGLSPATLVQRFRSKEELKQSALLLAWDHLDVRTRALAQRMPKTPAGAIALLVGLSRSYGGIEAYAEGLLVLREDFRDPTLRARGAKWKQELSRALDVCFADLKGAPAGIGLLMAAQWQGALLWWGFEPDGKVEDFIAQVLERFVGLVASGSTSSNQYKAK